MLKISKLTDYATVLMTELAIQQSQRNQSSQIFEQSCDSSASSLAKQTQLPLSTVAKLLKILNKSALVGSSRGVHGGYSLLKPAAQISMAQILEAVEGPIGITECVAGQCARAGHCKTKRPWQLINQIVLNALQATNLADLARHTLGDALDDTVASPVASAAAKHSSQVSAR